MNGDQNTLAATPTEKSDESQLPVRNTDEEGAGAHTWNVIHPCNGAHNINEAHNGGINDSVNSYGEGPIRIPIDSQKGGISGGYNRSINESVNGYER